MLINNSEYKEALNKAFECISSARYEAVVNANNVLLHRNWKLGQLIIEKSGWE